MQKAISDEQLTPRIFRLMSDGDGWTITRLAHALDVRPANVGNCIRKMLASGDVSIVGLDPARRQGPPARIFASSRVFMETCTLLSRVPCDWPVADPVLTAAMTAMVRCQTQN